MPGLVVHSALGRILKPSSHDRLRIYLFHLAEFAQCTTFRKLANLLTTRTQRWLHTSRVTGMPTSYFIDPINICNLRCPLCPTGRGILARPRGQLALDSLKKIVDEIAPYAYRVELYNWGEPLLHPDIFEIIEYSSQHRITVGLSSNLNRLDANAARRLIESGLSQLTVSIDGATQESYETYRRRGKLDTVLKNLQMLINTRRALGRTNPFIIWRMLIGKHNEYEIEAVRALAYEIGVDSFSTGVLYVDTHDSEQITQWLPETPEYNAYGDRDIAPENTWDCADLWETMVINWDGGVAPCCWLHDPAHDFGNALHQTVREVWNGPSYVSARRVIGGQRQALASDVPTICHRCRGHPHYMVY